MGRQNRFLLEPDAIQLLGQYGIPYPVHGLAKSEDEAVRIAEKIGLPVVLKVVSRDVVHKSDVGGVLENLQNAVQVREGYQTIIDKVKTHNSCADIDGILVVKQAKEGIEMIVGALQDPTFGPTLMFGLGGIFAEVLKDVTFRIAPITLRDAEEMVLEIKGYPMLAGVRGSAPSDTTAIAELLMSVSQMVTENPQIKELDLNPVRVYEKGLLVLDARMMLENRS